MPSRFVRVFSRDAGDVPRIEPLPFESFGEDLGEGNQAGLVEYREQRTLNFHKALRCVCLKLEFHVAETTGDFSEDALLVRFVLCNKGDAKAEIMPGVIPGNC